MNEYSKDFSLRVLLLQNAYRDKYCMYKNNIIKRIRPGIFQKRHKSSKNSCSHGLQQNLFVFFIPLDVNHVFVSALLLEIWTNLLKHILYFVMPKLLNFLIINMLFALSRQIHFRGDFRRIKKAAICSIY